MSNYLIISKEACPYCVRAKSKFREYGLPYQELNVPDDLTREEFRHMFTEMDEPLTVPKIYDGSKLIGGYTELVQYLKELGKR
jgi:glutaredoxin